jgi:hypothetical protein
LTHSFEDQNSKIGSTLRVLCYGIILYLLGKFLLYHHFAAEPWLVFGEQGLIENTQITLLGFGFFLMLWVAWTKAQDRPVAVLISGFLVSAIIREHNNYFQNMHEVIWPVLVGIVLVITGLLVYRWRRSMMQALRFLTLTPAFVWMAAGAILMLFAQHFGGKELWDFILGKDHPYVTRRAMEECFELVAYYFLLVGLFEYAITLKRRTG